MWGPNPRFLGIGSGVQRWGWRVWSHSSMPSFKQRLRLVYKTFWWIIYCNFMLSVDLVFILFMFESLFMVLELWLWQSIREQIWFEFLLNPITVRSHLQIASVWRDIIDLTSEFDSCRMTFIKRTHNMHAHNIVTWPLEGFVTKQPRLLMNLFVM